VNSTYLVTVFSLLHKAGIKNFGGSGWVEPAKSDPRPTLWAYNVTVGRCDAAYIITAIRARMTIPLPSFNGFCHLHNSLLSIHSFPPMYGCLHCLRTDTRMWFSNCHLGRETDRRKG
jgi:hypothetical protein